MKIEEAKITLLVSKERTTIEFHDSKSGTTFLRASLTPEQFLSALGRLSYVDCECDVRGLDRLNKKLINKKHEFEIPHAIDYKDRTKECSELIKKTLPEGWVSDNYFNSQDSFFKKDGKDYARTIIRKWVDDTEL